MQRGQTPEPEDKLKDASTLYVGNLYVARPGPGAADAG
jgi:hypothetical protein